MQIAIIVLLAVVIALLMCILMRKPNINLYVDELRKEFRLNKGEIENSIGMHVKGITEANRQSAASLEKLVAARQDSFQSAQDRMNVSVSAQLKANSEANALAFQQMNQTIKTMFDAMANRLDRAEDEQQKSLDRIGDTVKSNLTELRDENSKSLERIRETVDEKLQSTLESRIAESFKTVSNQLEQVYRGLGEMQTLANDVGGLKKVLSGIKTRGILGEVQLGAILEEILAPEQYEVNVATIPGSTNRVEYAIKLPAPDGTIYLPVDAKFAGDRYAALVEAQESGDKAAVDAAYAILAQTIKSEAKDIKEKYIETPYTTNFGVMFLPFEGLYAEVVNHGLLEELRQKYNVCVAGPSTMAALLNSLQMGFRTLAIQKKSNEVWMVLGAVKTEFDKFEGVMMEMQKHLNKTTASLETLMGTRTRAIQRKLRGVQALDSDETQTILGIEAGDVE